MKSFFVFLFVFTVIFSAFAQDKCATVMYHKLQREKFRSMKPQGIPANNGRLNFNTATIAGIITIPIVVHVIHNRADGLIGGPGNSNISDEQILSQITVLNEDYRRKKGTNGYNNDSVGADVEIEFRLATLDPDCQPTNGITRHYTTNASFTPLDDAIKSYGYWPNTDYLNIWLCVLAPGSNGNTLGYTQFPNYTGLPGLDDFNGNPSTDGIVVDHRVFGRKTGTVTSNLYNYGRTATHEIGHWMGLIHTWGDEFCGNDYCDDTPTCEQANQTSYCTPVYSNCYGITTRNMIENYLDYSPDLCMNIFTQDQKNRMRSVFVNSPDRIKILSSKGLQYIATDPVSLTMDFETTGFIYDKSWIIEDSTNSSAWGITNGEDVGAYGKSNGAFYYHNDTEGISVSLVSPFIQTQSFQNLVITFDTYYANTDITDSLVVGLYGGCDSKEKVFSTSYSGKELISSSSSIVSAPEPDFWKTRYVVVPIPSGSPNLKVKFTDYIKGNQSLYLDNINVFSLDNNLKVGTFGNPYLVDRLATSASYNGGSGNIKLEAIFNGPADVFVDMYDLTGKKSVSKIYSNAFAGTFYIDSFNFSAGIYLIKTIVNGDVRINKVLVY